MESSFDFNGDYDKGQQEYQNAQDEYRSGSPQRRKYYWMAAVREGRVAILGYRLSEAEAMDYVLTNCPGEHCEVIGFDSKDIHKVSGQIKSKTLEKYHDLDRATQRNILNQSEQVKSKKFKGIEKPQREKFSLMDNF
jgi:deoxycytidylate deaminase